MRRGFTLVELMVVIGIMAIMGSLTVAGYRQMKRGMEERSVLQNVKEFINGAGQRAQIDRQNVTVYFWNETLAGSAGNGFEVVVGKAIAVRRAGRISAKGGRSLLYDEFGDLEFRSEQRSEGDDSFSSTTPSTSQGSFLNLYRMSDTADKIEKSIVYESTVSNPITIDLAQGGTVTFDRYAFEIAETSEDVPWEVGDAYGFEFADITLPHGYIFGRNYSKEIQNPIMEVGAFYIKADGTSNGSRPEVNSLRPGSGGVLTPKSIGNIGSISK